MDMVKNPSSYWYRSRGITLIELMVVVVVVAILAGIAYPSYRAQAIKANRTEAKVELMQLTGALEKCYTRWHAYDAAGCDAETDIETPNYTIAADVDPTSYTLTATPR